MKFSANIIISTVIMLLSLTEADGRGTWRRESSKALASVTEATLEREISFLSDTLCKGRATGTNGNIDAAFWINRKFYGIFIFILSEIFIFQ